MASWTKVVTWTSEDNKVFVDALRWYSKDIEDRFTLIALQLPGKTVQDVINHYVSHIHNITAIKSSMLEIPPCHYGIYCDGLSPDHQDLTFLNPQEEDHEEIMNYLICGDTDAAEYGTQEDNDCQALTFLNPQEEGREERAKHHTRDADAFKSGAPEILPSCQDLALLSLRKKKSKKRERVVRWTEEEHRQFFEGVEKFGWGDWKNIWRWSLPTKTPAQLASHAQKYKKRCAMLSKKRKSIHDISIDHADHAT